MSQLSKESIYNSDYVRGLFDEMSTSYGVVNVISSLGFCSLWRRQCVDQIEMGTARTVVDLMSGMGELTKLIAKRADPQVSIQGYDISPEMCKRARIKGAKSGIDSLTREANVLEFPFTERSADAVVSCFGLKTFSIDQQKILAAQVMRILKPGGRFAFLEISLPSAKLLRRPFNFYLCHIIPLVGQMFMGNPDNYRLLGVYTNEFENCDAAAEIFRNAGLETESRSFFFGCATGLFGSRPD